MKECKHCQFYAGFPGLVCVPYPEGRDAANCSDFIFVERTADQPQFNPPVFTLRHEDPPENWTPIGTAYYGGYLAL